MKKSRFAALDITRIVGAHRSALLGKAHRTIDLGATFQVKEGGFTFPKESRVQPPD